MRQVPRLVRNLGLHQATYRPRITAICNNGHAPSVPVGVALRQPTRSYALPRYRDERHRSSANRFSRRRSDLEVTGKNASSLPGLPAKRAAHDLEPTEKTPKEDLSRSPGSFWSSYDTYQPTGPVIDEDMALSPPPVAPGDLLNMNDAAARILSEPSLVVVRQIEMMNVFLGFEQANRYRLVNTKGEDVGFLAEQEGGFGTSIGRQILRGHRPFNCAVMDTTGQVVLRVNRPISYINSRITISKGEEPPSASNKIGECQQIWSPFRRKYALFHRYRSEDPTTHPEANTSTTALTIQEGSEPDESYAQFANVDSRMLAWDFYIQSERGQVLASVNRNFMGFGRELFTDTGQYVLRFDRKIADLEVQQRVERGVGINEELSKVAQESKAVQKLDNEEQQSTALTQVDEDKGLTLDQRAVLLATAVTIDIDYFSRHGSGMHMPMLWMPMPGAGAPAEVPEGAVGAPGEAGGAGEQMPSGAASPAEESPFASPEYGESPGVPESPYDFGTSSPSDGGGGYDPFPSGQPDEVMQDPWATPQGGQDSDGGGGGLWGFFSDITGFGGDGE